MVRGYFQCQQCDEVLLLYILEHLDDLLLVLLVSLTSMRLQQLSVKLAEHLEDNRPCIIALDDSKHQGPQHHVFQKHIQHHCAFCQEKNQKLLHRQQDLVIIQNRHQRLFVVLKVLIYLRRLFCHRKQDSVHIAK